MVRLARKGPPDRGRSARRDDLPSVPHARCRAPALEDSTMHDRPRSALDADPRGRRVHVRAARRIRPRRRHPVSIRAQRLGPRTLMMNTVAPVWDGNETWLVLGGIGLLAAFPLAFAIIIPALYFPDHAHAAGTDPARRRVRVPAQDHARATLVEPLVLRGLDVATFFQGVVLGTFVQGFAVQGRHSPGRASTGSVPFPARHGRGVALRLHACSARHGWS